ncbi:cation diffusion facilitator family transporter [uncultured Sharpea sp.]|uniref:cation diffusion facilitator family transporter n=1 Tax=uncultured Sharpea sp. TaxID=1112738 RepID=UPI0025908A51|nr:cation diffusion facilitator family transporter [uncultured Sharpea sp.]
MENRNAVIIKTSIIGIATNVLLAIFKAIVGLLANSIAVVLDAINNLSDAMSSIITIVGTKLAGKSPDKKHPLGYGRVEYLSATLISFIVLYAGIASLRESIKAIISPTKPDYSTLTLVIIIVGVVTKIILGRYVKSVGVRFYYFCFNTCCGSDLFTLPYLPRSLSWCCYLNNYYQECY